MQTYHVHNTAIQKKKSRTFSETIVFLFILRRWIRIWGENSTLFDKFKT